MVLKTEEKFSKNLDNFRIDNKDCRLKMTTRSRGKFQKKSDHQMVCRPLCMGSNQTFGDPFIAVSTLKTNTREKNIKRKRMCSKKKIEVKT